MNEEKPYEEGLLKKIRALAALGLVAESERTRFTARELFRIADAYKVAVEDRARGADLAASFEKTPGVVDLSLCGTVNFAAEAAIYHAQRLNRTVSVMFNGTPLTANSTSTPIDVIQDWAARSENSRRQT